MRGSVRLCWTGSRIGLTFWRRARNRIGSGGRRKSEIDQPKRRRAKTTSCGNDGPWKEWKTKEQVSHSSHRPWKSARAADSHIHHSYGGGDCSGCGSPHTASLKQQHPKVGQNKPPKWAKRSCQTQQAGALKAVITEFSPRGSLLECWRPRRDSNPRYRRESPETSRRQE